MKFTRTGLAALCLGLTIAPAASGQEAITPAPPQDASETPTAPASVRNPQSTCQLHAWPAEGLRSVYNGWFHGGLVDGSVDKREGYPELPEQVLPVETQVQIMRTINLDQELGLQGYKLRVHNKPLPSHVIRRVKTPLIRNAPDCYAELVVDDVFYRADVISGSYLKAILRFREFDGGTKPSRQYGAYITRKLKDFPPKSPAEVEAAIAEFNQEFGMALAEFGEALSAPADK